MKLSVRDVLTELVAIPSVSGSEASAADFAQALLGEHGIATERVGASVVARVGRRADAGGPRLLMNTHLDTVPAGTGWTHEPFAATWVGERLYGRGSNDAKASCAAMLAALVELSERELQGELLLALTACEETSNAGIAAVLERVGRPDGAVTGEPTDLEVVRAQAGLAILTARWSGQSCHAAHVGRVAHENALLAAARDLGRFPDCLHLDGEHELLGASTVAVTVLHAGERHNVVPDAAEAVLDARLAPPHVAGDAAAAVARYLVGAEVGVRSARLAAVETAADHPLVQAALRAAGRKSAVGSITMSDMALLPGVPAVKCGPGVSARSHTADEYVELAEVEAGAAFYTAFAPNALAALEALRAREALQ